MKSNKFFKYFFLHLLQITANRLNLKFVDLYFYTIDI